MLSRVFRFQGPRATRFVQKNGQTVRHGAFSLRYAPSPSDRKQSRLAIIVSKKVDKRAVARNRIRRRVFELMRNDWDRLTHPYDMTIAVFDKEIATMDSKKIATDLQSLLTAAGLYKEK